MNVQLIAKYLTSARFEVFYHVPDSEKWQFFRHLLQAPFYDPSFCEIINQIYATNQYELLKKIVKQMRQQNRIVSFGEMDIDLILHLFWEEKDPQLAYSILTHFLQWNYSNEANKQIVQIASNLIFSASCSQDKLAALCILEQ